MRFLLVVLSICLLATAAKAQTTSGTLIGQDMSELRARPFGGMAGRALCSGRRSCCVGKLPC